MKKQNFFEDPKGVLQEIQQQTLQRQLQQQQQQQQPPQEPQILPQQRRRLSTLTTPTTVMPASTSTPTTISTTPSPLAFPSSIEQQQQSPLPPQQQQQQAPLNRRPKPGILRLDMTKPRRSSGGSVEFRNQPQMHGTVSFFQLQLSFFLFRKTFLLHSIFILLHLFMYFLTFRGFGYHRCIRLLEITIGCVCWVVSSMFYSCIHIFPLFLLNLYCSRIKVQCVFFVTQGRHVYLMLPSLFIHLF